MTDSGIPYHEWNKEKMEELAGKLTVLNRNRGWNLELATCGENLDFGKYTIIEEMIGWNQEFRAFVSTRGP